MNEKKRYLLRIDDEVYASLERWAADELRSVNAQIEFVLAEALRRTGRLQRSGPAKSVPQSGEDSHAPPGGA